MNGANPKLAAFVQAGGRSSRMGRDKSWIGIEGRPMIESVLSSAGAVADSISIIINGDNAEIDRYRRTAADLGAGLHFDRHGHRGPLGGIETALRLCRPGETALIIACDLPFVTPEFLQLLAEIHFAEGNDLTAPVDREGRLQMLAGIYSPACREPVERMLAADILRVDRLCPEVTSRRVVFEEYSHLQGADRMLVNINSESDRSQARRITEEDGIE